MIKRLSLILCLLLLPVAAWAVEDFTTYTEVDSDSDITLNATRITFSTMERDANSHVWKNYTTGYFGSYNITGEFNITGFTVGGGLIIAGGLTTSNNISWLNWTDGVYIQVFNDTSYTYGLRLGLGFKQGSTSATEIYANHTKYNQTYYWTLSENATNTTLRVYNDSVRSDLFTTLSLTSNTTAYSGIYALMSRNAAPVSNATLSGYTQNFNIVQADTPVAATSTQQSILIE